MAGGLNATGTFVVTDLDGEINIKGIVAGVEASVTAGIHIHSGFTCDDSSGVGGHYYEGMSDDPWTTTYTSNDNGFAVVNMTMSDFSLYLDYPSAYRTFVIHSTTSKIGCGIIGSPSTAVATIGLYVLSCCC